MMPSRPIMRRTGGGEPRRNDSTYLRTRCAFPYQPIVPTMIEAQARNSSILATISFIFVPHVDPQATAAVLALGAADQEPAAPRNRVALSMDSCRRSLSSMRSRSKSPFRGLRRGPAARRLRIRMTCAAYHRPPLGDGTLRALSVAAAASAGSATNSSRIGRNRSARSFSADRNL
jgi:hypothetical protein